MRSVWGRANALAVGLSEGVNRGSKERLDLGLMRPFRCGLIQELNIGLSEAFALGLMLGLNRGLMFGLNMTREGGSGMGILPYGGSRETVVGPEGPTSSTGQWGFGLRL